MLQRAQKSRPTCKLIFYIFSPTRKASLLTWQPYLTNYFAIFSKFRGPAPPIGTHRYAFLLFEQPNQSPLQVTDPSGGRSDGRKNFNTRQFAKKYGLGDPVAATYFLSHK